MSSPLISTAMPMATTISTAAAAASIHQWFAVAMMASTINVGWTTMIQRHRDRSTEITAIASIRAQPKCSDGIAAQGLPPRAP